MQESESVLSFSNRIRQLAPTLKSMNVNIDDEEMPTALQNGLPEKFDSQISAREASRDEKTFIFELIKSRLPQEEHRNLKRVYDLVTKRKMRL